MDADLEITELASGDRAGARGLRGALERRRAPVSDHRGGARAAPRAQARRPPRDRADRLGGRRMRRRDPLRPAGADVHGQRRPAGVPAPRARPRAARARRRRGAGARERRPRGRGRGGRRGGRAFAARFGLREVLRELEISRRVGPDEPEPDAARGDRARRARGAPGPPPGRYALACEALPQMPLHAPLEMPSLRAVARGGRDRAGRPRRAARWSPSTASASSGSSSLMRRRADPHLAEHGLTSVAASHRNRGIATALKRAQIAWASRQRLPRADDLDAGRERADARRERQARLRAAAGLDPLRGAARRGRGGAGAPLTRGRRALSASSGVRRRLRRATYGHRFAGCCVRERKQPRAGARGRRRGSRSARRASR